jgi:hypothetical protein
MELILRLQCTSMAAQDGGPQEAVARWSRIGRGGKRWRGEHRRPHSGLREAAWWTRGGDGACAGRGRRGSEGLRLGGGGAPPSLGRGMTLNVVIFLPLLERLKLM